MAVTASKTCEDNSFSLFFSTVSDFQAFFWAILGLIRPSKALCFAVGRCCWCLSGDQGFALDIVDDPRIDLTDPKVLDIVLGWIKGHWAKDIWLATLHPVLPGDLLITF